MSSIELSRVALEIGKMEKFLRSIGVHPSLWEHALKDIELAAVQKIIHNNRQILMDFNANGSSAMAERWDCSRRTAFRIRDKAKKECQNL